MTRSLGNRLWDAYCTVGSWLLILAIVAWCVGYPKARGADADDKAKRERELKAKVALALAATARPAAPSLAPAPREAAEFLPVVVYVGCTGPECRGAISLHARTYPGVASPAVVVQYPVGDRMVTEATFKGKPAPADVQKAVDAAAKKADVKPMPKGKQSSAADATPFVVPVSADRPGCVCGDDCKCAAGECPGACPVAAAAAPAINDGLDELNAKRAARGLRPYVRDDGLTAAAHACATYRATYRIFGHAPGRIGDFAFLPAGVTADSAGCAAYPASYGWLSCCMWENASHAGAAWVMGADGKRYMHVFVRNGGPPAAVQAAPAVVVAAPAKAQPVFVGYQKVCHGNWCEFVPVYSNP